MRKDACLPTYLRAPSLVHPARAVATYPERLFRSFSQSVSIQAVPTLPLPVYEEEEEEKRRETPPTPSPKETRDASSMHGGEGQKTNRSSVMQYEKSETFVKQREKGLKSTGPPGYLARLG